jgi:hypothetical protein
VVGVWFLKKFAIYLLVMNSTSFERARVINGVIMTNIYNVLDRGTPIFHEDLRTVDPAEKRRVSFGVIKKYLAGNSRGGIENREMILLTGQLLAGFS